MSSKVHTGFGHGCKRINKSQLDCLEHNDLITYIYCCMSFLIAYNNRIKLISNIIQHGRV